MKKDKEFKEEVRLSTPWDRDNVRISRGNVKMQAGSFASPESTKHFIEQRSSVHRTYIIELEKSKRLSLLLSVILLIGALAIMIFAPEGKQEMSYWIGGALLVFSAGAAGYKRIWAKAPMVEIKADGEN